MDVSGMPDWLVSLGTGIGGIGVTFLGLRKYLRSDSVDRANSDAKTTTIDMLTAQLEKSDARNDRLMKALDDSHAKMGEAHAKINELTAHVFQLEVQVRRLRSQLDELAPRADTLQNGPTP